jgi:signal transduction histidine kinase/ActR/RegA family two-component response regulator
MGQTLAHVFGRSLAKRHRADAVRALAGEPVVFEERFRTSQGRRWAQVTLAAGTDPVSGAPALYAFGIDITQRKRAEAQLSAARDEAQRANQAKTQFLSHMSHELRTPMNAIAGFSQLLLRDRHSPLSGEQREWVAQIRLGADHLLELINDILDLGRIEAGHLQVHNVRLALAPIVQECLSLTATLAHQRHIIWSVSADLQDPDKGPRVVADRTRLKQVLLNLLSNAIKYNRENGQVSLAAEERGDRVIVSVSDTGAGLSADACARLFKPFERLDAESAGVEGTGIGLALCRHLVTAMGGEIGLDSLPSQGSRFWISLPKARGDTQAARLSEEAALNSTTQRCEGMARQVLYIDDSGVNVMLMEILLAEIEGLELLSAQRPQDGLQLAHRHRPDLILLDIHMPLRDGFEVFRRLRADAATAQIPVIAVSANALQTDIDKALSAGFADYLTKPIDLDQAMALVRRYLASAAVESVR